MSLFLALLLASLPTPTNLSATAQSPTAVVLSWSETGNVSGFYVERAVAGGTFTQIAKVASLRQWTDSSAKPATSYVYRVRAYKGNQRSSYSAIAGVTTPGVAPPPPPPPPPCDGVAVAGTVNVSATVVSTLPVTLQLFVDSNFLASLTAAPWVFAWNTSVETKGCHSLNAVATDSLGQKGVSNTIVVNVQ